MQIQKFTRMEKILSGTLVGVLVFVCIVASSQNNSDDSISANKNNTIESHASNTDTDSVSSETKTHYPQVATIASAIIPGLGQAYNKKYWKIPIIWGGGLALYAVFDYNNTLYHQFKLASEQLSKEGSTSNPDLSSKNSDYLNHYREKYRRNTELTIIYMGVFYVANIIDALVDAHLLDYDVGDDLALHWEPKIITHNTNTNYTLTYGLNVQLRF